MKKDIVKIMILVSLFFSACGISQNEGPEDVVRLQDLGQRAETGVINEAWILDSSGNPVSSQDIKGS